MQTSKSSDLVSRMKGAARLETATFREIERDTNATIQAIVVVVLVSIATGIGSIADDGIAGLVGGAFNAVLAWCIFSVCVYWVGTSLIPAPTTRANLTEVLRTLGFSYTPKLIGILGFIPILGWFALTLATVWAFIAGIVATRQTLDMSLFRALATVLIAFIPAAIVSFIVSLLFGINGL